MGLPAVLPALPAHTAAANPPTPASQTFPSARGTIITKFNDFVPFEQRNAALRYLQLAMNSQRENEIRIGEVSDYDKVGFDKAAFEAEPTFVAADAAAASLDPDAWVKASSISRCDFELATEEGFDLMLPQLGRMRSAARLLRFSARRAFIFNEHEAACGYLAAMIRMGNHLSADGVIICSLVGNAIVVLALSELQDATAAITLSNDNRRTLLTAIDSINPDDPMLLRACIQSERKLTLNHLKSKFVGVNAGMELSEQNTLFSDASSTPVILRRKLISDMDEVKLHAEIDRAAAAYDAILDAWDLPDWKEAFAAIQERIQREEFGIIAALFITHPRSFKAPQVDLIQRIEDVRAALRSTLVVAATAPQTAQQPAIPTTHK